MKSQISRTSSLLVIAAALAGAVTQTAAGDQREHLRSGSMVVRPNARYEGKTYAEWSARYWQWYMAFPVQDAAGNPLPNPDFDLHDGQSGDVWFLGAPGSPERFGTVPEGKALFIGLPCAEASNLEEPPFYGATEEEQRALAAWFADHIVLESLYCEIDGHPVQSLTAFRTSSPQFTFTAPTPWIFGAIGGTGTSVADGYYVLIKPLSKGTHTISGGGNFHFSTAEGDPFDLDVTGGATFHIMVTDEEDGEGNP